MKVEEVLPGLFQLVIPLPNSPLKSLNSYVVISRSRCLVIDTGMRREECLRVMLAYLSELAVDLEKTDFFITHLHADHIGLVNDLASRTSSIFINEREAATITSEFSDRDGYWQDLFREYVDNGFPESEAATSLERHPGRRYGLQHCPDFHTVKDGDVLEVGDFRFACIETPGHSPGHTCLYEAVKRLLVSGDHILFDITPHIGTWPMVDDPLRSYQDSLNKVYDLEVDLVLTGHRVNLTDHRGRINELQEHHARRTAEVVTALGNGGKTAFDVAACLTWDAGFGSWQEFPISQKWFAVGETIAHLVYLEREQRVRRDKKDGKVMFSLAR
ncbi:MAG: MBL fold metallo-hydrolase [Chloroflexi bacterium]|nr:MBL fold metallo-hydrolase [Chloroflexota bacterium]